MLIHRTVFPVAAVSVLFGCQIIAGLSERTEGGEAGDGFGGNSGSNGRSGSGGAAPNGGTGTGTAGEGGDDPGTGGTGTTTGGRGGTGGTTGGKGGTAGSSGSSSGGKAGGGVGGAAGAPDPCDSVAPPQLDDDFDASEVISGGWGSPFLSGGAALTLDTASFLSAPRSLRSSLPANLQSGFTQAEIIWQTQAGQEHPARIRFSFDAKISAGCVGPAGRPRIAVLLQTEYQIWVNVDGGGAMTISIQEAMTGSFPILAHQPVAYDVWQHLDLFMDFTGTPHGLFTIGDGPGQAFTPHPNALAVSGFGPVSVFIGANQLGPSPACDVNYDNIVFDTPECSDDGAAGAANAGD